MAQDQPNNDIIKVDLEDKSSSRDFKITTMADDLNRSLDAVEKGNAPAENIQEKSIPIPVPTPAPTPVPPPSYIEQSEKKGFDQGSGSYQNTPPFLLEDEPKHGGMIKSFLLGFAVVFVFGGIGVGTWWYIVNRGTAVEPPPANNVIPPLNVDTPLVPVDKTLLLELDPDEALEGVTVKFRGLVKNSTQELTERSLVRIVPIGEKKPLTLGNFGKMIQVDFSPIGDNEPFVILFRYGENGEPTFGMAAKTSNVDIDDVFTTKEGDVAQLMGTLYNSYTNSVLPAAASESFLDARYQETPIRYLNFNTPGLAFDYAFIDDLVLLAGSREMMYELINRASLQVSKETSENEESVR